MPERVFSRTSIIVEAARQQVLSLGRFMITGRLRSGSSLVWSPKAACARLLEQLGNLPEDDFLLAPLISGIVLAALIGVKVNALFRLTQNLGSPERYKKQRRLQCLI